MNKQSRYINTLKKSLYGLILILMIIPSIQQLTNFYSSKPLEGSFNTKNDPTLSIAEWFEGTFQIKKQAYYNENFGYRNGLVRLNNQMYYQLFNQAKANGIIVGEEKYLFGKMYVDAYLGNDFIGYDAINNKVEKLNRIVDTLASQKIDLLVVLAPGKGSFYPEFFPKEYTGSEKTTTNYEVYKERLLEKKINVVDYYSWFNQIKDTSSYPLFPKTGIHWSKYGEIIVMDSLVNYVAEMRKDKITPRVHINKIVKSKVMRSTDEDIEQGMNLLFQIKDLEMGYAEFTLKRDSLDSPPKVLTVADSYYWGMYNWGLSRDAFDNGQFWFYNKAIHPRKENEVLKVEDINIQEEVQKNDVILLLSTDANLKKFAFGFIDQLYDSYYPSDKE